MAQMIARVESAHGWLENVTHQMNNVCPFHFSTFPASYRRLTYGHGQMSYAEQSDKIAGTIALLKQ